MVMMRVWSIVNEPPAIWSVCWPIVVKVVDELKFVSPEVAWLDVDHQVLYIEWEHGHIKLLVKRTVPCAVLTYFAQRTYLGH